MPLQPTTEKKPVLDNRMLVVVPSHPLIKHWVSVIRNEQTPPPIFKNAMAELGRLLMYEASRDWLVVPILRAGLALAEHASSILPTTKTYHLGGTILTAIDLIKERGVDNQHIKVVCAVTCPPALKKLSDKYPGLQVYAGIIDPTLTDKGMILPGLGDAGDRSFGT
ncbi:hypothetical protein SSX86_026612 [Deinandra increscens subsp. villosa]|uniref:uracil phosphoribosyltransferase n=1 Tax=Deinandra increscens subsp. villosa TaxID=3103831 RepID=A0AAP0GMD1_9ASTR